MLRERVNTLCWIVQQLRLTPSESGHIVSGDRSRCSQAGFARRWGDALPLWAALPRHLALAARWSGEGRTTVLKIGVKPASAKKQVTKEEKPVNQLKIAVAALALSCSISSAHAETIKIGVVQGLSGAPVIVDFGESYLQGIKVAIEDYKSGGGKHAINLVVYDDEANPQRAVSLVQRLIADDKVSAVIGTVSSGNVLAFAPILQRAGIPLMAGPAVATNITTQFANENPSFIFRCSMVEMYQIDALIEWAAANYKKIGLIHSTTGYGIFAVKEIEEGFKKRGVKMVGVEAAAPAVTELTPQTLALKNAGAELVLNFHEQFELLFRATAKLGYKPNIAGPWGLSSLKLQSVVGTEAIEGTIMSQALDLGEPRAKELDQRMRKLYGAEYRWPVVVALGYDAMRLVLMAADKAGSDPKALRNALEQVSGYKAITGTPSEPFNAKDHECLDRKDIFLGTWRNGEVVKLR